MINNINKFLSLYSNIIFQSETPFNKTNFKIKKIWNEIKEIIEIVLLHVLLHVKRALGERNWKVILTVITHLFGQSTFTPNPSKTPFQNDADREYRELLKVAPIEGEKIAEDFIQTIPQSNFTCLQNAGLSQIDIDTISKNAKSIGRLDEFISKDLGDNQFITILGTCYTDFLFDCEELFKCNEDFFRTYFRLTGSPMANTPLFMPKLMEDCEKQRKSIIFLIPPDLSKSKTTAGEIQWLIEHPEKMKHIHFVYGIYDLLNNSNFGLISPKLNDLERSVFRAMVFQAALKKVVTHYSTGSL